MDDDTKSTLTTVGAEALIALSVSVIAAIIKSLVEKTGMTKEQAIAALTKDLSDTVSDQKEAEAREKKLLEG